MRLSSPSLSRSLASTEAVGESEFTIFAAWKIFLVHAVPIGFRFLRVSEAEQALHLGSPSELLSVSQLLAATFSKFVHL